MNCLWPPIEYSSTHQIVWRKRLINQTTIVFVSKQDYERPHTNDGILDIEEWRFTKWIVTKHLGQNIITTLHVTNTSEAEEGLNDDNGIDIIDETI